MGTLTQYERLLPKLRQQPFGLRRLATGIETALRNHDTARPAAPAGLDLSRAPLLMGVLNLTPDSFSDGGSYAGPEAAVAAGLALVEEGADLVDLGGESTRPGADYVGAEEETGTVAAGGEGLGAPPARAPVHRHLQGLGGRPGTWRPGPT